MDNKLNRGVWSKEEDIALTKAVLKSDEETNGGFKWGKIARIIKTRSAKQCRERWKSQIDPSINKSEWSEEEHQKLLKLQNSLGNRWSVISKHFDNRPEGFIKNKWNIHHSRSVFRPKKYRKIEPLSVKSDTSDVDIDWGELVEILKD